MAETDFSIEWDCGAAYDLFVSLRILHVPELVGLRPKWASGMRARLSPTARETLELAETLLFAKRPTHWVHSLPQPHNASMVLTEMAKIAPRDRLAKLVFTAEVHQDVQTVLARVAADAAWNSQDLQVIRGKFVWWSGVRPTMEESVKMLDLWARAAEFGEQYLAMLQEYVTVFFAEEERRIEPALKQTLEKAQTAFSQMSFVAFLAEVAGGVGRDEIPPGIKRLTLVPSYWVTPFAFRLHAAPDHFIITFSGRPSGASLVPGEDVSDSLMRALKALSDPTRLRILQYLAESPTTSTQLAHRLRLRTSTIGHHIKQLLVAGLVRVSRREGKEILYVARIEDVDELFTAVRNFITKQ